MEKTKKQGWFRLDNKTVDEYLAQIGASAFAVYTVLRRIAGASPTCWPSIATISERSGVSKATVRKSLTTLVDAGLISIEKRPIQEGGNATNVYRFPPQSASLNSRPLVQKLDQGVVQNLDQGGLKIRPKEETKKKINNNPPLPPKSIESRLIDRWNSLPGVRRCKLTDARRRAVRLRLRDPTWLEEARKAMEAFPLPCWPPGLPDNEWRPTIEWFLKPDTVTKILEGSYAKLRSTYSHAIGTGQVFRAGSRPAIPL